MQPHVIKLNSMPIIPNEVLTLSAVAYCKFKRDKASFLFVSILAICSKRLFSILARATKAACSSFLGINYKFFNKEIIIQL
jgi:hypothetical protein